MKINKKILVTGGSGFIGSNLIDYLLDHTDSEIISLQRTVKLGRDFDSRRVKVIVHDLSCPITTAVAKELGDIKYIVHLAGKSDIKNSFLKPNEYVLNNVSSITNLIDHFKNTPVEKMIHFSTAEVFGPSSNGRVFPEDGIKNPKSPYALSKKQAEDIGDFYREQYGFPIITTYVMNIFGKRQAPNRFIPSLIEDIYHDSSVEIHCSAEDTKPLPRNYLHVGQVCGAICFLLENGVVGEKYNIASREGTDNLELAEMIAKILKKQLKYKLVRTTKDKQHALSLLCGKKMWLMGWRPNKTLFASLEEHINMLVQRREDYRWI